MYFLTVLHRRFEIVIRLVNCSTSKPLRLFLTVVLLNSLIGCDADGTRTATASGFDTLVSDAAGNESNKVLIASLDIPDPYLKECIDEQYALYTSDITDLNCPLPQLDGGPYPAVTDATGLEYFTNLKDLVLVAAIMPELDLSNLNKLDRLYLDLGYELHKLTLPKDAVLRDIDILAVSDWVEFDFSDQLYLESLALSAIDMDVLDLSANINLKDYRVGGINVILPDNFEQLDY